MSEIETLNLFPMILDFNEPYEVNTLVDLEHWRNTKDKTLLPLWAAANLIRDTRETRELGPQKPINDVEENTYLQRQLEMYGKISEMMNDFTALFSHEKASARTLEFKEKLLVACSNATNNGFISPHSMAARFASSLHLAHRGTDLDTSPAVRYLIAESKKLELKTREHELIERKKDDIIQLSNLIEQYRERALQSNSELLELRNRFTTTQEELKQFKENTVHSIAMQEPATYFSELCKMYFNYSLYATGGIVAFIVFLWTIIRWLFPVLIHPADQMSFTEYPILGIAFALIGVWVVLQGVRIALMFIGHSSDARHKATLCNTFIQLANENALNEEQKTIFLSEITRPLTGKQGQVDIRHPLEIVNQIIAKTNKSDPPS